ncbi:MAG: GHKL domain-containing protein [Xanthomonadales bacterium]|nr:GHKL domain-containing protein [Xanthomonadales bacterium]MDL1868163.1 GHKL domain-containing protein [Gammaproteobacteria bacterium PRO6]
MRSTRVARPLSLQARSLAAASTVLAGFLALAFFALDNAFYSAAQSALHERLQGYMYAYLAAADTTRSGALIPPEVGPDPRFDRPTTSGLYAAILGNKIAGSKARQWRSPSALDRDLPFDQPLPRGEARFEGPLATSVGTLYVLAQGVDWLTEGKSELHLTIYVAEDSATLDQQRVAFRRTLLFWLGILGTALLLLLLLVLRWSLAPLRRVAIDLAEVERGAQERLGGAYPIELRGLTRSIDNFIEGERERVKRYRNTLSDLAHSLKTPLAVMRSQLESEADGKTLRWNVLEQVGRMDEIVAYQLSRAATSGHQTFATPLPIEPYAEEVVRSLEKVYAGKNILCEFELDAAARFHGDQGDLLELLGNLLENAFKWARRRVLLGTQVVAGEQRAGMTLWVEDDGPGIADDQVEHLLQRGVRGDERVQGHGIGLSIVQDIVKAYRGELQVSRSPLLGGARFSVTLPAR